MLRFPNPGSTLANFVAVYVAAFEAYNGQVVDLDDLVKATIDANLVTSSGYMGEEAIKRSTRKDRSKDSLYNQLKMYAELFRSLGWLRSTKASALNYTFTLLGEQVVAAKRDWKPLLEEVIIGIAYPNHVLDVKGHYDIRPFSLILQTMLDCNECLSRDEIIIGPLNEATDRKKKDLSRLKRKVMSLRNTPDEIETALKELSSQRGIQVQTLRNYTRWPLAVLRDLDWTVKDSENYSNSDSKFEVHRLTSRGKFQALRLRHSLDLRIDQIDKLPFNQKSAVSRSAHFAMLERAGFDIKSVADQINENSGTVREALGSLGLAKNKNLIFSPFQSLSVSDSDSIFPTLKSSAARHQQQAVTYSSGLGRGSRAHLFVKPKFVTTAQDDKAADLSLLKAELEAFRLNSKNLANAALGFAKERRNDTQSQFYPLIPQLFSLLGFQSDYSRAGVNYQRWDAWVAVKGHYLPIEIKSPTEEEFLSTKAIRQAIENKVILLSRGGLETTPELSTLVVGYKIPNERGEMSKLIDDVQIAFNFKIGVLDLQTLVYLAMKSVLEGVSIDEEQLSHLKGFLDV